MTYQKKISIVFSLSIILIGGLFFVWLKTNTEKELTLEEAFGMGEVATHKLLVQIENPKGKAEDVGGRYERGDIVLIFPAEHQFSLAEKEGFLILRMELTPKQAEILIRAKEEEKTFGEDLKSLGGFASKSEEMPKILKRRKFVVDLAKIGIAPEDQRGREVEDKIFSWNTIVEK